MYLDALRDSEKDVCMMNRLLKELSIFVTLFLVVTLLFALSCYIAPVEDPATTVEYEVMMLEFRKARGEAARWGWNKTETEEEAENRRIADEDLRQYDMK